MAEVFLTQPLQIVAGSVAGSKWMSDDLYQRAASKNKNFHVVKGANHMSLYDVPQYVDEAVSSLLSSLERIFQVQRNRRAPPQTRKRAPPAGDCPERSCIVIGSVNL